MHFRSARGLGGAAPSNVPQRRSLRLLDGLLRGGRPTVVARTLLLGGSVSFRTRAMLSRGSVLRHQLLSWLNRLCAQYRRSGCRSVACTNSVYIFCFCFCLSPTFETSLCSSLSSSSVDTSFRRPGIYADSLSIFFFLSDPFPISCDGAGG